MIDKSMDAVLNFLRCRTPEIWFQQAPDHVSELLVDHANCEKKAAGTALSLLYRYVDKPELLRTLSRLAREELKHFEQVLVHLQARHIDYVHISPSRYASGLRKGLRNSEPERLIDILLVGAIVEARSCERFLGLVAVLPKDLASFYERLLASEARHFHQYLALAGRYSATPFDDKLDELLDLDAALVKAPDVEFRFHSGPLTQTQAQE
ncbi:MAG: tRNA-(ms[2]io[6]A)-hydroxylase [Pseudomonadales bacterium]